MFYFLYIMFPIFFKLLQNFSALIFCSRFVHFLSRDFLHNSYIILFLCLRHSILFVWVLTVVVCGYCFTCFYYPTFNFPICLSLCNIVIVCVYYMCRVSTTLFLLCVVALDTLNSCGALTSVTTFFVALVFVVFSPLFFHSLLISFTFHQCVCIFYYYFLCFFLSHVHTLLSLLCLLGFGCRSQETHFRV